MKKLMVGLVAAAGIALAAPALAQGVYFGAGPDGVGVGVGAGSGYYHDDYARRYRSDDYDRPRYRGYRSYDRTYAYGGCRPVIIERGDGSVRRVRRCG